MALSIQQSELEGVTILTLNGRITVGESNQLRDKVTELSSAGTIKIVMDLEKVDYIDSTGLGALVMMYSSLKRQKGAMKLVHLNRRSIELLLLTKLHTIFEVFGDVQDAVNSFFPDRKITRFDILSFVQEQASEGDEDEEDDDLDDA